LKYFIVRQDAQMNDIVQAVNGQDGVDATHIRQEKAHLIRRRTLLMCKSSQNLIFPDLLTTPFLMFSARLRQVASIYQKDIPYKEIVLLEQEHAITSLYFLPILPIVDCVTNPYHTYEGMRADRKPVLDYSKCKNLSVFKFEDLRMMYTVMSLELLESILIRKCIGLTFEQIQMI
jgi:hypothetical protein